ncbi:MAG TPA: hypothetical protein VMA36_17500 [Candidatus Limnocylindria bacterium]|jgi:hypothetical protein|nr:hypothetical protein [Candidatus Limnocylindria bacterium]
MLRCLALACFLAVGLGGGVAFAQALPNQTLPPYAAPHTDQTIHGRIVAIDGPFTIQVRDERGYVDSVQLHRGTIIDPTGLTLAVGMEVTILGYNAGTVFEANEIDTPYNYAGPPPPPLYYGPGWWYPGYVYGYGPAFGLTIVGGTIVHRPFPHPAPYRHPPYPPPRVSRPYIGHPHAPRVPR